MTPEQKKKIGEFFHYKTVDKFLGHHPSKAEKKNKMKALYLVASDVNFRRDPPGSWLIEMDRKFRNGEP